MTRIAVDAMGGDNAPGEIVRGALLAQSIDCEIVLVGEPEALHREVSAAGGSLSSQLRITPAADVVPMDESPSKALRRRDSSMFLCVEMVRLGEADAAVSAGNSGAMMAMAMMTLGKIPGIERPAIAAVLPTLSGKETVLLDAGAQVDCSAENLLQFALMGNELAMCISHVDRPRIALLSIGEEEAKGNSLTSKTTCLLRESGLNFIGNVEGRHLLTGDADVIVCDGFVGNVALKAAEGTAEAMHALLNRAFDATVERQAVSGLMMSALQEVREQTDYERYGGAPLLGVNGVCIIGHGRSNSRAVMNAIGEANEAVRHRVVDRIRTAVKVPTPA